MIKYFKFKKFIVNSFKKKTCEIFKRGNDEMLRINEPAAPEYVLLGLILVIFLPLNNLPKI
jgi:hypothetical protein